MMNRGNRINGKRSGQYIIWYIIFSVVFIFLFAPSAAYYSQKYVKMLFSYGQYPVAIICIILYMTVCKHINPMVILVVLYYIWLTVSTLFNGYAISEPIKQGITDTGIICFSLYVIKKYKQLFFDVTISMLLLYAVINIATIILFRNGMYINRNVDYLTNNYFLGYDNQHINYLLPLVCFSLLRDSQKTKGKLGYISYLFMLLTAALTKSGATIIVTLILGVAVFGQKLSGKKIFNIRFLLLMNFVLEIVIVVIGNLKILQPIIGYLGKSNTLSGRVTIWQLTISRILYKPLYGWGLLDYNTRMPLFNTMPIAALHAHNRYMEVMFEGGTVLLLLYIIMLLISANSINRMKDDRMKFTIAICLFAYLTGMLTEYYGSARLFFTLLAIPYELKAVSNQQIKNNIWRELNCIFDQ